MKYLLVATLLILAQPAPVSADRLGDEIEINLPQGWSVVGDTSSFPFLLMPQARDAELLIFKSVIEAHGTIDDRQALKFSVDRVIDSVIMTFPNAKLLTSTGYLRGDHAGFTVEFTSEDSPDEQVFFQTLTGMLYRTPDEGELLYTLWSRMPMELYPRYKDPVAAMMRDCKFTGDHAASVFVSRRHHPIAYSLVAALSLLLAVLVYYRGKHSPARQTTPTASTWQCTCGTVNEDSNSVCGTCGQPATVHHVTT